MEKRAFLAYADDDKMCREVDDTHGCCEESNEGGLPQVHKHETEINDRQSEGNPQCDSCMP